MLSQLAARLRRAPDDVSEMLPFDEVVAALGCLGERHLGLQAIPLDAIVGSVNRAADFDRWFRPGRGCRARALGTARPRAAGGRGPAADRRLPASASCYFVRDGHHRVSVAIALRLRTIDAFVTEVRTRVDATGIAAAAT